MIDGDRNCYLCHQPLRWFERTTFYLMPGTIQMNVEVHTACLEKLRAEQAAKEPTP